MSGFKTGVTGAIAWVLMSGAAQFAMGRDLPVAADHSAVTQSTSPSYASSGTADTTGINRSAKADRAAGPFGSPASLRTISLTPHGVADSVILMRVPVAATAPVVPIPSRPATRKT